MFAGPGGTFDTAAELDAAVTAGYAEIGATVRRFARPVTGCNAAGDTAREWNPRRGDATCKTPTGAP